MKKYLLSPRIGGMLLVLFLLLCLCALLGMYPIVLMRRVIDQAVAGGPVGELLWGGGAYILLQVLRSALSGAAMYLRGAAQAQMSLSLQLAVFRGLQNAGLSQIKKGDPAKISDAVIHDTQYISENLIVPFSDMVSALMSFVFGLYFLCRINGALVLLILPMGLVSSAVIRYAGRRSGENIARQRRQSAGLWDVFNEGILGFLSIRLHEYTQRYIQRVSQSGSHLLELQKKQARLEGMTHAFTSGLFMVTIGGIMVVCALMVRRGTLTFGGLTAVMMYNHMLTDPLLVLQDASHKAARLRVSLDRVAGVCTGGEEGVEPCRLPLRGISIRGLSYGFGGRKVLDGLSMEIGCPSSVGIYGPTGAGKSTLANLICGIYQSGDVTYRYAGEESGRPPRVSYLLQDEYLFNDSILNNILVGDPQLSSQRLEDILRICRVQEILQRHGGEPIGKNGSKLSGGERKRVQLARTLADSHASVYVFDEMSAALDSGTFSAIWKEVDDFLGDKLRIYIEHNRWMKPFVDQVIEIGTCGERK